LFVGGEIGISAGGNIDYNTGHRWNNINIIDNVMLAIGRDQPTNRTLGWYIEASDWKSGDICGNYLLHNDNPSVTNLYGIHIDGHSSNVTVSFNLVYGLKKGATNERSGSIIVDKGPKEEIRITDNLLQLVDSKLRPIFADEIEQLTFTANKYFSEADEDLWFRAGGVDYDFQSWASYADDISSSAVQHEMLDPERSFETYLLTIGVNPTVDAFVAEIKKQTKYNWRQEFTAKVINEYIKEGYGGESCPNNGLSYFPTIN